MSSRSALRGPSPASTSRPCALPDRGVGASGVQQGPPIVQIIVGTRPLVAVDRGRQPVWTMGLARSGEGGAIMPEVERVRTRLPIPDPPSTATCRSKRGIHARCSCRSSRCSHRRVLRTSSSCWSMTSGSPHRATLAALARRRSRARPPRDAVLRDRREPRHLPPGLDGRDQARDAVMPERLAELKALLLVEARRYNVLPLDDRRVERSQRHREVGTDRCRGRRRGSRSPDHPGGAIPDRDGPPMMLL